MTSDRTGDASVLVITPALNEEGTVGDVVRRITETAPSADVLVVDDGSTDRTAVLARRAGATVSRLPYNLGVGGAIRVGYRYAHRRGYDAVVQIDADGQHDPADVPTLLAALDRCDVVVASRFADGGDYPIDPLRRFAMRLLARSTSRVANRELTDVTSGFRASGPRAIALFARWYPVEYMGDTVEALVIAAKSGLTIGEVPVRMSPRVGGRPSQGSLQASMYVVRALGAIALSHVQRWPDGAGGEPPTDDANEERWAARWK